jgi:cytochrome P450
VFDRPQDFDIHRHPNPPLSFGIAEHFCLGSHLARLEGRVFFEELFDRFSAFEPAGPAVRVRSNLNNAYRSVPMTLVR